MLIDFICVLPLDTVGVGSATANQAITSSGAAMATATNASTISNSTESCAIYIAGLPKDFTKDDLGVCVTYTVLCAIYVVWSNNSHILMLHLKPL